MRAPRNFTLTPSMAGSRRGFLFTPAPYPILGLTSIIATLFFVLITAGSFAVRLTSPAQTEILSSEIGNARQVPQFGMGGGGGGGGAVEPPVMMVAPTEAGMTLESESAPLTGKALEVTPLAHDQPAPTDGVLQAMSVPQEPDLSEDPLSAKAPPEQIPTSASQSGIESSSAWSFLWILQIFLVLLAIITGLAALYIRRNPLR